MFFSKCSSSLNLQQPESIPATFAPANNSSVIVLINHHPNLSQASPHFPGSDSFLFQNLQPLQPAIIQLLKQLTRTSMDRRSRINSINSRYQGPTALDVPYSPSLEFQQTVTRSSRVVTQQAPFTQSPIYPSFGTSAQYTGQTIAHTSTYRTERQEFHQQANRSRVQIVQQPSIVETNINQPTIYEIVTPRVEVTSPRVIEERRVINSELRPVTASINVRVEENRYPAGTNPPPPPPLGAKRRQAVSTQGCCAKFCTCCGAFPWWLSLILWLLIVAGIVGGLLFFFKDILLKKWSLWKTKGKEEVVQTVVVEPIESKPIEAFEKKNETEPSEKSKENNANNVNAGTKSETDETPIPVVPEKKDDKEKEKSPDAKKDPKEKPKQDTNPPKVEKKVEKAEEKDTSNSAEKKTDQKSNSQQLPVKKNDTKSPSIVDKTKPKQNSTQDPTTNSTSTTIKKIICPEGYFMHNSRCLACPSGSSWNGANCVKRVPITVTHIVKGESDTSGNSTSSSEGKIDKVSGAWSVIREKEYEKTSRQKTNQHHLRVVQ